MARRSSPKPRSSWTGTRPWRISRHWAAVRPLGGNRFQLVGDLTIRDMTREVTLEAEYVGVHDSPFGTKVATFSAGAEFDREDFGMTWNVVIETGGLLVSKKVEIELEIEAVYQA